MRKRKEKKRKPINVSNQRFDIKCDVKYFFRCSEEIKKKTKYINKRSQKEKGGAKDEKKEQYPCILNIL